MDARELTNAVESQRDAIVSDFCSMLRVKAVGPESGGEGEHERAEHIIAMAKRLGLEDIEVMESSDPSVPSGKRPNIIIRVKGRNPRKLWVVSHMDTVPEGDPSAWDTPPYEPTVKDGRIYARGSEDNGQELMASLYGLATVVRSGIVPELDVGLVLVADEEHGNVHGIEFLLAKGIFKKGDLVVVPDHGAEDGSEMEVVEKGIAWIDVEVVGKQTHASTPDSGVNALEASAKFLLAAVSRLREKYAARDSLFEPPRSTFEATRCESNGPNVNTVPGKQRFAFDFRVLPGYPLDDVMADLRAVADEVAKDERVQISLSFLQKAEAAPKTPLDSEVVRRLSAAIALTRTVVPRPSGIGGGTCAAPFRRDGMDAVVWATVASVAHDANEYCIIDNLVGDAKVYALMFAGDGVRPG
ncbi:MAG: M20 family metallo-hydrolase [Thermoplasmata archaeon]